MIKRFREDLGNLEKSDSDEDCLYDSTLRECFISLRTESWHDDLTDACLTSTSVATLPKRIWNFLIKNNFSLSLISGKISGNDKKSFAPFFLRISRFSSRIFFPIFEEIPLGKLRICPSTKTVHSIDQCFEITHVLEKVFMSRDEYAALHGCEY